MFLLRCVLGRFEMCDMDDTWGRRKSWYTYLGFLGMMLGGMYTWDMWVSRMPIC